MLMENILYTYIHTHMCVCVYIYIEREREREIKFSKIICLSTFGVNNTLQSIVVLICLFLVLSSTL